MTAQADALVAQVGMWHTVVLADAVAFGLEGPLLFVVAYVKGRPAVERLIALAPVTACFWTLTVARQAQAAYVYWQSYIVFYTRTFPPANDTIFQRSVLPPLQQAADAAAAQGWETVTLGLGMLALGIALVARWATARAEPARVAQTKRLPEVGG
jgi:hypothetical protein